MNDKDSANDEKTPDEKVAPDAIAPVAGAEETVGAPEGAPAVVQMMAMAEEAEAVPAIAAADTAAEPVTEAETAAVVEEAPGAAAAASIRLEEKHPLAIRWMHWINFPVLATMIWSGLLIYWGDSKIDGSHQSAVYRAGIGKWTIFRFFPQWFWTWYPVSLRFWEPGGHGAAYNITMGLGYHFFFMWFFMLNGLAYVIYTLVSGEWRYLVPTTSSFKEAIQVTLYDLHIRKEPLPHRKFNGAQQIAYTAVILMGIGSLVTGLAIYKPSQAHLFTQALGGYEMARWCHFWVTMGYCVFFVIHVSQVAKAGWNNFRAMVSGYEIVPANEPSYTPDR
jgi:thiosulfate reductase cytochrome b subunit